MRRVSDVIVVGGGFYGCAIAIFLADCYKNVVILEKEKDLLTRASYKNQARVHNGYHYPRSFLTASRSHANHSKFTRDYKEAIEKNVKMVYAIASNLSKTSARQFEKFADQLGSPLTPAEEKITRYFNPNLIEKIYEVEEKVFNAGKLRDILKKRLKEKRIKVKTKCNVLRITKNENGLVLKIAKDDDIFAKQVYVCAYSGINDLLEKSKLPVLPLKHELTEMPLIKVPDELKGFGITVMDGPFFGVMPFPDKGLHTIHHVRYTPRDTWLEPDEKKSNQKPKSNYMFMIKDAQRYIPIMKKAKYKGSLYEVRTVLLKSEASDSRPILFRPDYQMKGLHIIMGGKIDNIYDILKQIKNHIKI